MHALVVYESIYGNTHEVAKHIAIGLQSRFETTVVSVGDATGELVAAADLLVVGGPTHLHRMSSARSRHAGRDIARRPGEQRDLDPHAADEGLRDWFRSLPTMAPRAAAAFDTRTAGPALLAGRASRGIAARLREHGYQLVVDPESFLVDGDTHLLPGEATRAEAWAASMLLRSPSRFVTGTR